MKTESISLQTKTHIQRLNDNGISIELLQKDDWWQINASISDEVVNWGGCAGFTRNFLLMEQASGIIEGIAISLGLG
ncbi:hypothetical protein VF04_04095 [Nostoc linckia z7]|uniref:Uncharacterized protein n=2 Tax=Nostoc linckia TaxID=92942 RepID=A0A9Q5ZG08_NOSLI|nr:hypothetical protein [Nostoc linckia]PHK42894.1 hypothetical protein VF12_00795 [Nostoc linckia z15]PHK48051.1 hypothetical protein VF13_01770 [Nostoc linckia z16]PHJ64971.1 hypothetical protein VF02_11580 [Nostoc linckia z1]PHJ70149.1 hypothetical protein VF05_11740 [Nostoc linckia z3]PHJ75050.1 hypothetical protein VF03_11900 [Nostoc linckia z2]